jgi:hypothetical protein
MPPSRNRANESPDGLAPVVVGRPGVRPGSDGGGGTGDVYFDMRASLLPPTVDDLRPTSHPKVSFQGRAQGPGRGIQAPGGETRPALPLQAERRFPSLATELAPGVDGLLRTTGAVTGPVLRPDDYRAVRDTNRLTTSDRAYVGVAGNVGSAGGAVASEVNAVFSRYEAPFRATLPAPAPGHATAPGGGAVLQDDHGRAGILVYGNNRDDTQFAPALYGNVAGAFKALIAPVQDLLRTTKKEGLVDAGSGLHGQVGALQGRAATQGAQDALRVTRKEGLAEAPTVYGNVAGQVHKLTVYDAADVARTTMRQTQNAAAVSLANLSRGPGMGAQAVYFDPVHGAARVTRAEALLGEAAALNLVGGRRAGVAHDPSDVARHARKETTLNEPQLGGPRAAALVGQAYDPADVARATGRQTMPAPDTVRNVNNLAASSAGGYTTAQFEARTTMRQLDDESGGTVYGQAAGRASTVGMGYAVAPTDLKATQREIFADMDYFGGGQSANLAATAYDTYDSVVIHSTRDETLRGRAPTDEGAKAGADLINIGRVQALGSGGLELDRRSLSPMHGRSSPSLPPALVQSESTLHLSSTFHHRDPVELGMTDVQARRLGDDVSAASCQRQGNPLALDAWA